METTLKTAATSEPISLDEAKTQCRIDLDETMHDNDLIELITDARIHIEDITWRKLITQTWYAYFQDWPKGSYIELPFGELQSVTAIKYTDVDNSQSTWSSAEYIIGTDYQHGRITLDDGYTWPNENLYPSNPIEVEFVCGYGDTATDIPSPIRRAIRLVISGLFENREPFIIGTIHKDLDTVKNLLSNYWLNFYPSNNVLIC